MKHIVFAIFAGITVISLAGAGKPETSSDINAKVAQLDLSSATMEDVNRIFGKPRAYVWGDNEFTEDNLPPRYIAVYPHGMSAVIARGHVHELRFESQQAGYMFRGKIHVGSSLDVVFDVLGQPQEILEGEPIGWKADVLYRDVDGKKGYCYYRSGQHNVRMFFLDYKVASLYLMASNPVLGAGVPAEVRSKETLKNLDDCRWMDLSGLDLSNKKDLLITLWFNQKTIWPQQEKLPPDFRPAEMITQAMNPGLGIRNLHQRGITGKGVNVGVIDQPLYQDHPEFASKIAAYHDVGCGGSENSMHGPAVASLLVGTRCGTAPGAKLYYVAAPSWTKDTAYQAHALDWIIEQNKQLPEERKIRVVSLSGAPSGPYSPFDKNQQMWDEACARAEAQGILVLDCTHHRGFIGPCCLDPNDPENVAKCIPGFPWRPFRSSSGHLLLVPISPRTTAEQYARGKYSYQYCGNAGLSWAIPYCAGVLALGWQVRPDLSPQQMRELLFKSAYITKNGGRIIYPKRFIRLAREAKVAARSSSGK